MKLVLHSVGCWGNPNLRTWTPDDPDTIAVELMIDIGEKGKKGADMFTLKLATPKGLLELDSKDGIIATRPLLVMERYDFQLLWDWLQKTIATCERETWLDCVAELRVYFLWEYEGMRSRADGCE